MASNLHPPEPDEPSVDILRNTSSVTGIKLILYSLLVILVASAIYGAGNYFSLWSRLRGFVQPKDSITLIQSYNDGTDPIRLIVVSRNGRSEVRTLNVDSGSEGYIANPRVNSFSPAYSPITQQLAFLTQDNTGHLALQVGKLGQVASDRVSIKILSDAKLSGFEICPFTRPVWSTDGTQVAIFICNPQTDVSSLLVSNGSGGIVTFSNSDDRMDRFRSVVWIDAENLLFTKSVDDQDIIYRLSISAPDTEPTRMLGP
jgi:hypothetical protein